MSTAHAPPIFSATATHSVAPVALTTLTVVRATIVYTDARCVCNRRVMSIPGVVTIEVRVVKSDNDRSGRGRVVHCKRCSSLLEVIEHR